MGLMGSIDQFFKQTLIQSMIWVWDGPLQFHVLKFKKSSNCLSVWNLPTPQQSCTHKVRNMCSRISELNQFKTCWQLESVVRLVVLQGAPVTLSQQNHRGHVEMMVGFPFLNLSTSQFFQWQCSAHPIHFSELVSWVFSLICINDINNETFFLQLVPWDGSKDRRCVKLSLMFQLPSNVWPWPPMLSRQSARQPDSLPGWCHGSDSWLHLSSRAPAIYKTRTGRSRREITRLSGVRLGPWISGADHNMVIWWSKGGDSSRVTGILGIFRSWIYALRSSSIYLGQWHQRDLLPALQGFRIRSEWVVECHMGTGFSKVSELAPATSVQPEQAWHQGFQQRWFLPGSLPNGRLQHHRFSGFRWIRNPKQPKSHTFSFLSSTDRMDAGTAFGLPFMSDHVWASCLMFKMFRTCRNIILSLWLLIYFVLLRLQVLLRNCCTCFSQCTNSGPLSWEFQDVCHSSTMASHLAGIFPPCILQRCSHDSACGTLSRSMTPTRPSSGSSRTSKWFADVCRMSHGHCRVFWGFRFGFPGNH